LHLLSNEDAFARLVKFPGIGPKTASCVLLFCLQRPSFAVDTHVFRLCQYLAWVPKEVQKGQPPVNRETTFAHCEARVPDDLKYPLHQLLIKHGKECPRCRAATSTNSERWEEGCPIEHLVTRHGAKKGEVSPAGKAAPKTKRAAAVKKGKGKKKVDSDSEETESSGLSDLESDDDYDECLSLMSKLKSFQFVRLRVQMRDELEGSNEEGTLIHSFLRLADPEHLNFSSPSPQLNRPHLSFSSSRKTEEFRNQIRIIYLINSMEKAFGEFIENAVTAAVDKAIPASVNHAFVTAVEQAVKEKMKELEPAIEKRVAKEIESAIEKRVKRAIRKAELEERLEQLYRIRCEHACLINFGPKSWNRWLENKNEEDEINQVRWRSELDELMKEEEKIKETAQQG
ncbi:DNA glycosylase, partial [Aureobasidium melanogenum]